ncbi:Pmd1p KNAG_0D02100 [Huiozyma naganishii CBS 8797]|uniref:Attractin/MKLN-like beta-propeller domain-containing protein n=1 Tax=Huiozyma naganishii (strain ATCC MYA-139 / BCRC 22969 / CBS 8797 / KCTC 17520 / NBRC 10181 / NCYC 3082 / Yp74L-3) TaxID=1071383 RepID=J7R568_HUIN7|nr:hypothetical protein KNAG_0D02100 [Kazachstania naganishii CBS 8797]CCK69960.1 hypothetical protein KNAG_0D02100 [Kazachstania naganishii CBS 8797]
MALLRPSSSTCYKLRLPELPAGEQILKYNDDSTRDDKKNNIQDTIAKRRLLLECRTGAAVDLSRSEIFVHGGLIIPLNLNTIDSATIQKEIILYFAKQKNSVIAFKNLSDWISREIFFLDLISRKWNRLPTSFKNPDVPMRERLFHTISYSHSAMYVFGGLIVSTNGYELIATNELWKLDLTNRVWSLLSEDPQITRRFNHTTQVLNTYSEAHDTKLLIIGGLNNMDQSIAHIDVFNITKGYWETANLDSKNGVLTNVGGEPVCLTNDKNAPLLIEHAELEASTLTFYLSQNNNIPATKYDTILRNAAAQTNKQPNKVFLPKEDVENEKENIMSPVIALPLLPKSKGMRMISTQSSQFLKIPLNLKSPSAVFFKKGIIVAGFHKVNDANDLHCYIFDLSTADWTKLSIDCPDSDLNRHRFWKLFGWTSHHRAVLLGTEHDDLHSSTVQKFDYLLSFRLAIMNILSKTSMEETTAKLSHFRGSIGSVASAPVEEEIKSPSQFENYIKYITSPLEIESTSSVFPPYAMVLGKDALGIFGKSISDFELITSEGDSVTVPLYLLRERWGRYFNFLLANGYTRACNDYEDYGLDSGLINLYPDNPRTATGNSTLSRTDPIEEETDFGKLHLSKNRTSARRASNLSAAESHESSPSPPAYILSPQFEPSKSFDLSKEYMGIQGTQRDNDRAVSPSQQPSTKKHNPPNPPVFRVPFKDSNDTNSSEIVINSTDGQEWSEGRRRASDATEHGSNRGSVCIRRASHPLASPTLALKHTGGPKHIEPANAPHLDRRGTPLREFTSSNNSRRSSAASQNSGISFVSSSSDRRGVNLHCKSNPHSRRSSSSARSLHNPFEFSVLNIMVPPQSHPPQSSLPPTPNHSMSNLQLHRGSISGSRKGSIDRYLSEKRSSFSRRRSSQGLRATPFSSKSGSRSSSLPEVLSYDKAISELSNGHSSRKSSHSSRSGSVGSATHAQLELEPLLTPRSLYMPWPTATVKAFAEFFYTGQVNGKWLLSPVVSDLLIMAQLYEIPLLYDMIAEVLYSIIGKKEESLKTTVFSMENGFCEAVNKHFDSDEERISRFLEDNETFKELTGLRESLKNINNGFMDIHLLKKFTRSQSLDSTNETSNDDSESTASRCFQRGHQDSMNSTTSTRALPNVLYAGGPRNSHNSVGSILYPAQSYIHSEIATTSIRHKSIAGGITARRKRSNLNKEIGNIINDENNVSSELDIISSPSKMNQIEYNERNISEIEEQLELFKLQNLSGVEPKKKSELEKLERTSKLKRYGVDKPVFKKVYTNSSLSEKDIGGSTSSSSQSDSDEQECNLGALSVKKMRKEMEKDEALDESIDPLLKVDSENIPASPNVSEISNINLHKPSPIRTTVTGPNASEMPNRLDSFMEGSNTPITGTVSGKPTIESMVSPTATPPIDYIVKLIYRTSVLVNDSRLMLRCMDCIEFSKLLKKLKKNMVQNIKTLDLSEEEESSPTSMKSPLPVSHTPRSSTSLLPTLSMSPASVPHGISMPPMQTSIGSSHSVRPATLRTRVSETNVTASSTLGTLKSKLVPSIPQPNVQIAYSQPITPNTPMPSNSIIHQQISPRTSVSPNTMCRPFQEMSLSSDTSALSAGGSAPNDSLDTITNDNTNMAQQKLPSHTSVFSSNMTVSPKMKGQTGSPLSSINTSSVTNGTTSGTFSFFNKKK